ncbi:MAG: patatin-like phospholipase family protein, partial [Polyangiales bacterium]
GVSGMRALDEAKHFMRRVLEALHATPWGMLSLVSGLGPLDHAHRLRKMLSSPEAYGDMKLRDLDRRMLVVSLGADTWAPKLFRNFATVSPTPDPGDGDLTLVDVALASSAFPLYLPIHGGGKRIGGSEHFVDGALVANNPAMCALANALQYQMETHKHVNVRHLRDWLPSVRLLSLGAFECGKERDLIERSWLGGLLKLACESSPLRSWPLSSGNVNWGWLQWLVLRPLFLVDLMAQGSVAVVSHQCRDLLDEDFFRFAPSIEEINTALRATLSPPAVVCALLEARAAEIASGDYFKSVVSWAKNRWMFIHDEASG